jgi:hypothetical protein
LRNGAVVVWSGAFALFVEAPTQEANRDATRSAFSTIGRSIARLTRVAGAFPVIICFKAENAEVLLGALGNITAERPLACNVHAVRVRVTWDAFGVRAGITYDAIWDGQIFTAIIRAQWLGAWIHILSKADNGGAVSSFVATAGPHVGYKGCLAMKVRAAGANRTDVVVAAVGGTLVVGGAGDTIIFHYESAYTYCLEFIGTILYHFRLTACPRFADRGCVGASFFLKTTDASQLRVVAHVE